MAVWTKRILAWSIVGLGAGMNLGVVLKAGRHGLALTFCTILATLGLGFVLSRFLRVRGKAGLLVSAGTAICGGSAIAALAPAIDAPEEDTSVALATVFLLNAAALVLFPAVGHALGMGQRDFGFWSALAIHDTSSVVGAGLAYGAQALQVGTTVKLARALWIVPLTLGASILSRKRGTPRRYPWFILGFLLAAAAFTWLPSVQGLGSGLAALSHKGMALALFGIGAGISLQGPPPRGTAPPPSRADALARRGLVQPGPGPRGVDLRTWPGDRVGDILEVHVSGESREFPGIPCPTLTTILIPIPMFTPTGRRGSTGPSAWGILLNTAFLITEVIYGIRSHSLALVADAAHNFGDVLSLGLAWTAAWLAGRMATDRRTYGFRRRASWRPWSTAACCWWPWEAFSGRR